MARGFIDRPVRITKLGSSFARKRLYKDGAHPVPAFPDELVRAVPRDEPLNRYRPTLANLRRSLLISRSVFTNPVHPDVEPAFHTSICDQLIRSWECLNAIMYFIELEVNR